LREQRISVVERGARIAETRGELEGGDADHAVPLGVVGGATTIYSGSVL
jgi:hypothetical protein